VSLTSINTHISGFAIIEFPKSTKNLGNRTCLTP
jgi:hypothetical protein